MKSPSLWKTIVIELFSLRVVVITIFLALVYIFSIEILLNYRLIQSAFSFSLLYSLFIGSFTSMDAEIFPFILFILNALFVGVNIILLYKAVIGLRNQGKVHISVGGATLFSLVTAGCASCGLSLLSVLGLSATLTVLPFHGAELRVISLGLLVVSAFYMLKKLHEAKYCRI